MSQPYKQFKYQERYNYLMHKSPANMRNLAVRAGTAISEAVRSEISRQVGDLASLLRDASSAVKFAAGFCADIKGHGVPGTALKLLYPESARYVEITGNPFTWGDLRIILHGGLIVSNIPGLPSDIRYVAQKATGHGWHDTIDGLEESAGVHLDTVKKLRLAKAIVDAKEKFASLGIGLDVLTFPILGRLTKVDTQAAVNDFGWLLINEETFLLPEKDFKNVIAHEYLHFIRHELGVNPGPYLYRGPDQAGYYNSPHLLYYSKFGVATFIGFFDALFEETIATYAANVLFPRDTPPNTESAVLGLAALVALGVTSLRYGSEEKGAHINIELISSVYDIAKYAAGNIAYLTEIPEDTKRELVLKFALRKASPAAYFEFCDYFDIDARKIFPEASDALVFRTGGETLSGITPSAFNARQSAQHRGIVHISEKSQQHTP